MRELVNKNKVVRLAAGAERGFTLIEVMVTLLILAVGMLASFVGAMTALDHSLMNEMRNDAIKIAQEQMEAARNMPYANIQNIQTPQSITRQVRKNYVTYTVKLANGSNQAVAINQNGQTGVGMTLLQFTVIWFHKGPMDSAPRQYQYVLQSLVRQTK